MMPYLQNQGTPMAVERRLAWHNLRIPAFTVDQLAFQLSSLIPSFFF
jgi:hypothetical protein